MVIESVDHYNSDDFELLKGVGMRFHPLITAYSFCKENGVTKFFVDDLI